MKRWTAILIMALAMGGRGLAAAAAQNEPSQTGADFAEKLLRAVGGPEAWAGVAFVHVEAVHDDLDIPGRFQNRIWNDLSTPRVRFWAGNEQFTRARRIDGDFGVREIGPNAGRRLSVEEYALDKSWWESNVYRTFRRMALRDPALAYRAQGASRLEILRPDGSVLNWFVLNQAGEPMLFGSGSDTKGTAFGPLATTGKVKYPKWGARADGSWRYEIVRFEVEAAVPADAFPPRSIP